MQVKNILINDFDIFINILLKELCENQIPYLYINEEKELHINDVIYRFYQKEEVLKSGENIDVYEALKNISDIVNEDTFKTFLSQPIHVIDNNNHPYDSRSIFNKNFKYKNSRNNKYVPKRTKNYR